MGAYQTLEVSRDSRGLLTVALNRPEVRNAFNEVMIEELGQVFQKEGLEEQTRLILLKGNGPVFSAGGDLNWMKKAVDFSYEENLKDTRLLAKMFDQMNRFPKPVIGVVHGAAIGGGIGLVSVCDIVITEAQTVFSLAEVRLGIVPACIGPFVIAKVGASHARGLFMSAQRFGAERAKEIALVHEVEKGEEGLKKKADEIVNNILSCGPNALQKAKELVLNLSWPELRADVPDCLEYVADLLSQLRITDEGQEGVRAFLEKRKPSWLPDEK